MNLAASTDKSSYVAGEKIKVTLAGGMQPQSTGWVGIRIYDTSGVEVSTRKRDYRCTRSPEGAITACDLSAEISITAQAGWTALYVAWVGNEFELSSPTVARGAPVTGAISVGSRPLKDQSGIQTIAGHIEELVLTNSFSVTADATDTPKASGGGSFDWIFISGLIGMFFARRTIQRK